ncbi:MAG: M28 family peptidase [Sphingobacteriales bacterium JAD_PAG50586_3]|nr:MAG: M28 family peptidase [Sphingobacteriales bacterium JAD_PAG50586_3]
MKNSIKGLVFATAVAALTSCGPGEKPPTGGGESKPSVVIAPEFNADSAFAYIDKQVSFGPRVPGTKTHADCAQYLINKLKSVTDTVIVQRGTVTAPGNRNLPIYNIFGRINPQSADRIMLFAHWDSRHIADQDDERKNEPILGANDGASGVGVLLEIARIAKSKNPGIGIDIFFTDAEDQGMPEVNDSYCLGTQYWITNPPIPFYKPRYAILLDMVGGKDAKFWKEEGSVVNASFAVDKVWAKANELGYGNIFVNSTRAAIIDDHYYVNGMTDIPAIDIIQYNDGATGQFPSYWHTHDDNMGAVDKATLKAVGQTLLGVIYNENVQ